MLPFVFEWFAVQTVGIKKNLIQYHFLYLDYALCKPLQSKKNLIQYFFVFEQFPVQTIAIKKNLIQYFFVFEWFSANRCN